MQEFSLVSRIILLNGSQTLDGDDFVKGVLVLYLVEMVTLRGGIERPSSL